MFKRTLSALLALLTVFSILPMAVFAAEDEIIEEEIAVSSPAGLSLADADTTYESEPNNSQSAAQYSREDMYYSGEAGNSGDVDYYYINVSSTQYLSLIAVSGAGGENSTKFRLYNSSGTLLKTATYEGEENTDDWYSMEYSLAPGVYYLKISDSVNWVGYQFYYVLDDQLDRPVITLSNKSSTGKPVIKWNSVANAEKYKVYRSTSKNGTYSRIITTTGTSYTDTSAKVGKTYYYKVIAITSSDYYLNSRYSAIKSRTCDCARPVISLTHKASTGKNIVKWDAIDGAAKYEVWYSTSKNGTYTKLGTASGTSLIHNKGVAGKVYYYKVKAISEDKESANSAFSSSKYATCDLARPDVTISRNSSGKPKLTWDKISGASKYQVYRSKDGENWTLMKAVTGTSYTNTSATAGVKYYYKVRAIHSTSAANSAYSTVKSITSK